MARYWGKVQQSLNHILFDWLEGEKKMTKNFEAFLKLDKSNFQNKYVIIVKGKVIAKGEDIEKMIAQVRKKYPEETPLVAKILDERMLVL
jgi:hypothetical protein